MKKVHLYKHKRKQNIIHKKRVYTNVARIKVNMHVKNLKPQAHVHL